MPDSAEVRLARLDEVLKGALNRLETMSEAYAPTNRQVIENALRIADIQSDLQDIRNDRVRRQDRTEEWFRKIEQEVLACATANGELEKRLRNEAAEREGKEHDLERARRQAWALAIFSAFVALLLFYLGTVVGG